MKIGFLVNDIDTEGENYTTTRLAMDFTTAVIESLESKTLVKTHYPDGLKNTRLATS